MGGFFSETRTQRALRRGTGDDRTRRVGSKVTKRDIFHSEIYYNTIDQRPVGQTGGGLVGAREAQPQSNSRARARRGGRGAAKGCLTQASW